MKKLWPEQQESVEKLKNLRARADLSALGSGKTLVAVTLDSEAALDYESDETLIISPTGQIDGWVRTIHEQDESLNVCVYDKDERDDFIAALESSAFDVYIIPWSCLRVPPTKGNTPQARRAQAKADSRFDWGRQVLYPVLTKKKFFHVIADEAHRAGNFRSQAHKALVKIPTVYKTALTGSFMRDKPFQCFGILKWLYPKRYTSFWKFYNEFTEWEWDGPPGREYRVMLGTKNEEKFWKDIESFVVMRPPRKGKGTFEYPIYVNLTPKQQKAYDGMRRNMLAWVGEHGDEPLFAQNAAVKFMRLQQFTAASATVEPYVMQRGKDKGKVVDRVHLAEPSAKLDAVQELIEDNADDRFLVYSQFRDTLELLANRLKKLDISYGMYIGGADEREIDKDLFSAGKLRCMLATIRAGSEAIDGWQHSCHTIIFLDRSLEPEPNRQAIGRLAGRPGQQHLVQVIDLIARGTIDETKPDKIKMKADWIENFLQHGRSKET